MNTIRKGCKGIKLSLRTNNLWREKKTRSNYETNEKKKDVLVKEPKHLSRSLACLHCLRNSNLNILRNEFNNLSLGWEKNVAANNCVEWRMNICFVLHNKCSSRSNKKKIALNFRSKHYHPIFLFIFRRNFMQMLELFDGLAVTYFFLWDLNVCPWSMHADMEQRVWANAKLKRLHQPKECLADVSLRSRLSLFQKSSKNSLLIVDSDAFGISSIANHLIWWLRFFWCLFFFFSPSSVLYRLQASDLYASHVSLCSHRNVNICEKYFW